MYTNLNWLYFALFTLWKRWVLNITTIWTFTSRYMLLRRLSSCCLIAWNAVLLTSKFFRFPEGTVTQSFRRRVSSSSMTVGCWLPCFRWSAWKQECLFSNLPFNIVLLKVKLYSSLTSIICLKIWTWFSVEVIPLYAVDSLECILLITNVLMWLKRFSDKKLLFRPIFWKWPFFLVWQCLTWAVKCTSHTCAGQGMNFSCNISQLWACWTLQLAWCWVIVLASRDKPELAIIEFDQMIELLLLEEKLWKALCIHTKSQVCGSGSSCLE